MFSRCDGKQWSSLDGAPTFLYHNPEELWDGTGKPRGKGPGGSHVFGEGI